MNKAGVSRMAITLVQTAVVNHKGLVRGNNEDNFYLDGSYMHREKMDEGAYVTGSSKERYQLYAVCDGMGGADCGEEASFSAVTQLAEHKKDYARLTDEEQLTQTLRGMSENVYDEAVSRGQKSGTTIAMVLVDGSRVHIANVGDSRIYRLQKGMLSQVSVDHSKVQRLISMGLITPEQARTHKDRHVINQFLGMPRDVKISPHIDSSEKLRKDDIYLLCSDGLTDMVEDEQIEAILKEGKEPGETAQKLVKTALKNGGRDNVTVMVLKVLQVAEEIAPKEVPSRDYLRPFLTGIQVLIGGGLALTVIDLIYYLMHR